jgi:hypothetical protein
VLAGGQVAVEDALQEASQSFMSGSCATEITAGPALSGTLAFSRPSAPWTRITGGPVTSGKAWARSSGLPAGIAAKTELYDITTTESMSAKRIFATDSGPDGHGARGVSLPASIAKLITTFAVDATSIAPGPLRTAIEVIAPSSLAALVALITSRYSRAGSKLVRSKSRIAPSEAPVAAKVPSSDTATAPIETDDHRADATASLWSRSATTER